MRALRELTSHARLAILGGRTMRENHEWWLDRCRRDANQGGANWVPPPCRVELPPVDAAANEDEALRLHLDRTGVPERIRDILRGPVEPRASVQAVRQWWGHGKSFILLHGDSGGGKSVAASTAFLQMREVVRWDGGHQERWDSTECTFETAHELATMPIYGEESHAVLKHLGKVTCLVLDDLGVEMMSAGWLATLDSLLAERFGRTRCRTILTTNISADRRDKNTPSQFEARYGVRIARRIRESGSVVAVEAA